jgi:hypothetical protein
LIIAFNSIVFARYFFQVAEFAPANSTSGTISDGVFGRLVDAAKGALGRITEISADKLWNMPIGFRPKDIVSKTNRALKASSDLVRHAERLPKDSERLLTSISDKVSEISVMTDLLNQLRLSPGQKSAEALISQDMGDTHRIFKTLPGADVYQILGFIADKLREDQGQILTRLTFVMLV